MAKQEDRATNYLEGSLTLPELRMRFDGDRRYSRLSGPAHLPARRPSMPAGVLVLIPVASLTLLYFIAVADWPIRTTGDHHG